MTGCQAMLRAASSLPRVDATQYVSFATFTPHLASNSETRLSAPLLRFSARPHLTAGILPGNSGVHTFSPTAQLIKQRGIASKHQQSGA
jgi:hypothetical protein